MIKIRLSISCLGIGLLQIDFTPISVIFLVCVTHEMFRGVRVVIAISKVALLRQICVFSHFFELG